MKVLARKMKNFKTLAIFENFLKNFGALNQNSGSTEIFVLSWRTHSENLKVLAQKIKKFKILSIFDNFWKFFVKFWGPKSKFWYINFLAMVQRTHSENFITLPQKLREEFQNIRKPHFGASKKNDAPYHKNFNRYEIRAL